MHHPKAALGIRNWLAAETADSVAHVAIDPPPHQRHLAYVSHPAANQEFCARRASGREKPRDLFWPMLAIAVENNDVVEVAIQPMTQACLDRFAFAGILRMDNDLRSRILRASRGCIWRAVINHQNIVELLKRAPDNIGNVLFLEVSGNDRRHRR